MLDSNTTPTEAREIMVTSDDRITTLAERHEHIALTCRNHPDKRWSTKNIGHIGARSIFYNLMSVEGMGPECNCSANDLVPVLELEWEQLLAQEEAGTL